MKTLSMTLATLALAAGTAAAQVPAGQEPAGPAAKPHTAFRSATAHVTAVVTKIDYTTREVTLRGADQETTVVAGESVKNLEKVKPGDTVSITYKVGLLAEARPATAEEKANPKQVALAGGRTLEAGKPAGALGGMIKVVATVDAIDKAHRTITFKGPGGQTEKIEAENPANLDKVKVGDTVVFTYTESVAIAVAPAKKPR